MVFGGSAQLWFRFQNSVLVVPLLSLPAFNSIPCCLLLPNFVNNHEFEMRKANSRVQFLLNRVQQEIQIIQFSYNGPSHFHLTFRLLFSSVNYLIAPPNCWPSGFRPTGRLPSFTE